MSLRLIISCEHAGNDVPKEYQHLFEHNRETLETHRGIDIGALELTNTVADKMQQEPHLHTVTRLLVDLNRSVQSPTLFSEYTRDEPLEIREDIFDRYYLPHREKVKAEIENIINEGHLAVHVGVHTFTPIWEGQEREVDIGFLFDPTRDTEKKFCELWREAFEDRHPGLRLKMNEPYRGTMDGFTTYLRRNYPPDDYMGMEIEVSQRFTDSSMTQMWSKLQQDIATSLQSALDKLDEE